jgi:hypothetical protein
MSVRDKFRQTFKSLLPSVGVIAFEVIGGVVSFFWALVMIFSVFLAAGLGIAIAQAKVIPALGLGAGVFSSIIKVVLAFFSAFAAIVIVEVVEIIILVLVLFVIAGMVALIATAWQGLRQAFSR